MAAGWGLLSVLHSLKGLGLSRDHKSWGCWTRHVPGVEFGSGGGLRGLRSCHGGVGWWGLRKTRRLSIFLESCYGRWTWAVATLSAVMHH